MTPEEIRDCPLLVPQDLAHLANDTATWPELMEQPYMRGQRDMRRLLSGIADTP